MNAVLLNEDDPYARQTYTDQLAALESEEKGAMQVVQHLLPHGPPTQADRDYEAAFDRFQGASVLALDTGSTDAGSTVADPTRVVHSAMADTGNAFGDVYGALPRLASGVGPTNMTLALADQPDARSPLPSSPPSSFTKTTRCLCTLPRATSYPPAAMMVTENSPFFLFRSGTTPGGEFLCPHPLPVDTCTFVIAPRKFISTGRPANCGNCSIDGAPPEKCCSSLLTSPGTRCSLGAMSPSCPKTLPTVTSHRAPPMICPAKPNLSDRYHGPPFFTWRLLQLHASPRPSITFMASSPP